MQTLWSQRYALCTRRMRSSTVRELLKLTEKPDIISFAGGLPAPEVFPLEAFEKAAHRVIESCGAQALQYSMTEGCPRLREMIARNAARCGINVQPENVLITSGSQQALDLIGKIFLNPGDRILLEKPTYLGALQAWNAYQAEYVAVEIDDDGMRTDQLESALRAGPKFIYVLPNFQNPSGVTLSMERRLLLIEQAHHFGIPIIEDDPYGLLRYEGEDLPSLVQLDSQARSSSPYNGNVIYISTFSKILAPGLRLGWILAPVEVIERLVIAKQGTDLHTGTFVQMVAYEVAQAGFLDEHIFLIRSIYRERRDAMLQAMEEFFPPGVQWTKPRGGLFLWVTLPPNMDALEVFKRAVEKKVAFVPGNSFFAGGENHNTMRLNYTNADPNKIREGIKRLGLAMMECMEGDALAHALSAATKIR
jgi:2-aminoadipate transaminase